jgi:hypothetical protein
MSKRLDLEKNKIFDACVCHGSAGIAHFFNRMYHETKMKEFYDISIYWIETTLKMASFSDGLAGFKTWHTEQHGGWVNEYCLLEGISGIGLSLLSFYNSKTLDWDKAFLMS